MPSDMRVVVTGSESFIGKEVIAQCRERDIDVIGIDTVAPKESTYTFVQGDIRDPALAGHLPKGTDAVIHLAALSRDPDCKGEMQECFDINVMGTLNMLKVAGLVDAKQFIFASSEWVYDSFLEGEEKDEEAPIAIANIQSEYSLSKLVSESTLRIEHMRGSIPVTVLRFGIIYGPRKANWAAVESLASKVKRGERIEVGSLRTGRRFVHVRDIAEGILLSIGQSGFEIFNLTGDSLVTLGDIISRSEGAFQTKAVVDETSAGSVSVRNPSNAKAKKVLQWRPRVSLAEGLRSIESYL